jgi:hypothetical protein
MRLRGTSDSTGKGILYELEAINLGLVKIMVERVAVVKFRMNYWLTMCFLSYCRTCGLLESFSARKQCVKNFRLHVEKVVVTVTTTFKSGGDMSPPSHTKLRLWLRQTQKRRKIHKEEFSRKSRQRSNVASLARCRLIQMYRQCDQSKSDTLGLQHVSTRNYQKLKVVNVSTH